MCNGISSGSHIRGANTNRKTDTAQRNIERNDWMRKTKKWMEESGRRTFSRRQ